LEKEWAGGNVGRGEVPGGMARGAVGKWQEKPKDKESSIKLKK